MGNCRYMGRDESVSKVKIGVTRIRVTPGDTPLTWKEQMIQVSSDMVEIDLPEGDYLSRVWIITNGECVLDMPLEMRGITSHE